jgi:hypothetical protein
VAVPFDARHVVLKDADARARERAAHALAVEPPVVIAEHGVDAERRAKVFELRGDLFGLDELAADHVLNHEVAEQEDEVGPQRVDLLD